MNTGALTACWGGVGSASDPVNAWPNGVISLTFDDSGNKQFTVAAPKLSQYWYRGTLYPILDSTGLTQAQIRILHDRMGCEIGANATTTAAHTAGLTAVSLPAADAEVRATRQYLLDNGYEADTFDYPLGNTNAAGAGHRAEVLPRRPVSLPQQHGDVATVQLHEPAIQQRQLVHARAAQSAGGQGQGEP